ncbi:MULTISPECIES: TAT-variant-translocated molybdopterin oxidoreductase [unclassified Bradyrhizobium]|uniref:TAT-variant-translocated molybdopterin oxidoreductase n=1 Tax=unclassified Bradyrhizobium TaxID=2631580 RepID=UPI0024787DD6|nr:MULTISPECIES: TAT-variant-translocated molybdopterin oxidoreductase [unclassified Bradyrhizobium]WGR70538.1 TAT-variant-translocated molybdopterin oxidoreductase [Bradyrhizobium sp. ISRA426]WGR82593.1 TAT-variant-translocated molybdopterin oxidoreductase [Bradyrhizobium sp. ISRA430]WGR85779.1 TAT-variant-translocated molybdopterin oxidoreductase [Bradyrhizobium sp. ISRA432]
MKRRIDHRSTDGPRVWAGIEELSDDPRFQAFIDAEYPAVQEFSKTARREFLKLMGASFALAGLTGCEKSSFVAALPYVDQPASETVGLPRYYATAVLLDGFAQPVIATTHAGRPTKLDGNPGHPATRGRSDVFMQSAVLQLYDPDRAAAPSRHGEPVSWADVESAIGAMRESWRADQGEGVRLLLGPTTSPTLRRQIDSFLKQFPKARVHVHAPTGLDARRQITAAVYGQAIDVHYVLANCDVVVSLDDDFLGPGPDQLRNALGWSQSRRRFADRPGNQLFMAESVPSATGALAARRLIADARRMPALAEALANAIGVAGASRPELTDAEGRWIARAAAACKGRPGRSLIVSGLGGGAATGLWVARINQQLGNAGQTLKLTAPISGPANAGTLAELVSDINSGRVSSLIVFDINPAYGAPGELGAGEAIKRVRSSIHLGLQRDETGALCEWQLPLAHALESWSDARAVDGTATILQPVISPFYDVRTVHQIVAMLLGEINPAADAAVRATWQASFGDAFEARWKQALHDGFVEGAASFITASPASNIIAPPSTTGDLDIVFRPDPTVWDGQFANVGWLQELPKTLTTVTWSNVIAVSPAQAKRLAASNGDHVEVRIGERRVSGPLWIMPGQADNTVALFLGYGRTRAGRVGNDLGYDAYRVQPGAEPWLTRGSLRKLETNEDLAVTQLHHRLEGFDLAREVSPGQAERASPNLASLYAPWPKSKNAWGMVIDLDSCIGCNACVAACTAENNVPVVGADQVRAGREMHWLRIGRYYTGDIAEPRSFFEPVPCMHCEDAPCEMGCPVHATTHSPEGVNQMVYNRCIGTRTCSSYCPYKVRRFNFYDYRAPTDSSEHAAHNPDVTVRSRGVMEKCTYCTQRIEAAHVAADKENRPLRDGEVVTACQQACPTKAIVFGDINDSSSEVSRLKRDGRHYVLLEELGTRPRTTYLARWREDETESRQG